MTPIEEHREISREILAKEIEARRFLRYAEAEMEDMAVAIQAFPFLALNYVIPWCAMGAACWWLRLTWRIRD